MAATMVFFFNRLHPHVDPTDYERWVRETDYPTARALPAIRSYDVVRLDGPLRDDEVPFDYVEVVEVTDLASYRAALDELPNREAFIEEIRSFVGEATAVHGTMVV
jgi:hypothetical protein